MVGAWGGSHGGSGAHAHASGSSASHSRHAASSSCHAADCNAKPAAALTFNASTTHLGLKLELLRPLARLALEDRARHALGLAALGEGGGRRREGRRVVRVSLAPVGGGRRQAAGKGTVGNEAVCRTVQGTHRSTAPASVPVAGAPGLALTLGVALRSTVASALVAAAPGGQGVGGGTSVGGAGGQQRTRYDAAAAAHRESSSCPAACGRCDGPPIFVQGGSLEIRMHPAPRDRASGATEALGQRHWFSGFPAISAFGPRSLHHPASKSHLHSTTPQPPPFPTLPRHASCCTRSGKRGCCVAVPVANCLETLPSENLQRDDNRQLILIVQTQRKTMNWVMGSIRSLAKSPAPPVTPGQRHTRSMAGASAAMGLMRMAGWNEAACWAGTRELLPGRSVAGKKRKLYTHT
jgi:hypothetical protein